MEACRGPQPFGGDLTERSRIRRRQKDVSASAIPEEGTQPSHDFRDDIDFAEEDPMVDGADDDRE
eukprot:4206665-Amphidinium_carterae.1